MQKDVTLQGHAIQCRINAEDPKNNFMPCTGTITAYLSPGGIGVRIDGAVYKDYTVSPYYDALLAKLTVRGRTWEETVSRMRRSLEEYVLRGVKTTIPFMKAIMQDQDFHRRALRHLLLGDSPRPLPLRRNRTAGRSGAGDFRRHRRLRRAVTAGRAAHSLRCEHARRDDGDHIDPRNRQ